MCFSATKSPARSDTLRELVKRGAAAVPHLIAHLDDQRPTKITIRYRSAVGAMYFEDEYDYAWVLQKTESFFWDFCDNYLELVKSRRYGDFGEAPAGSANGAMVVALSVLQRLFAPYLPFVADEVWSWWQQGSVHQASWPTEPEILQALACLFLCRRRPSFDLSRSSGLAVLGSR